MWRAKMDGSWPNRPEKVAPMACNASSAMPSGMRMASVTNCVTMSWPTSEIRMRLWPSTRPAFPSGETSQQAWHINIVAARNRSKIVRSGSFSPPLAALATRCSTGNSIFLVDFLEDRPRCEKAGIPDTVGFQTKCELGRRDDATSASGTDPRGLGRSLYRVWQPSGSAHLVGRPPVLVCPGCRLDRTDWDDDSRRAYPSDGGTSRTTIRQPAGLAALECEDWHKRTAAFRVGVSAHFASLGRRRAALVAHSSHPSSSNRKDLLPGLRPCWHPAGGDGLGGRKPMGY